MDSYAADGSRASAGASAGAVAVEPTEGFRPDGGGRGQLQVRSANPLRPGAGGGEPQVFEFDR